MAAQRVISTVARAIFPMMGVGGVDKCIKMINIVMYLGRAAAGRE
jgi:hypothetical protein